MLMRPVGAVFGMYDETASRDRRLLRALWAGIVISLAAFAWALYYVTRLASGLIGAERAAGASLLLAAYPFALFYNAPYTESLFLLGAVAACDHFRRREWTASSIWGVLAGLTRPNGCFVALPLAVLGFEELYRARRAAPSGADGVGARAIAIRAVVAAMPVVGMLVFTLYLYRLTGVWFAWARSHEAWGRTFHGLEPVATMIQRLSSEPFLQVVADQPSNALNAAGVLFALALIYPVFRRLGPAWGLFVLVNLIPPLLAGGLLSMGRLSATLFPLFLALAALVAPRNVPAWAALFGIAQGLCAALFFTWRDLY
jgi:Gpi18-like mannosyltransferase